MEDYIFLIIAVAISIFAAINKSQKAKMAGQPNEKVDAEAQAARRRRQFMDQLLGEDFLADDEEEKAPPMRVQPAPQKVVFKSSSDIQKGLNYQLPRFRSTLPDRPKHKTITTTQWKKVEEEAVVEPEESISYLEDFSFRKAIVYSQIIERKY